MASPVGHTLGGLIVYALGGKKKINIVLLVVSVFFALLPDMDFLFGYFSGNPNKYHHGFTHSLVFVILTGIAGAWIYQLFAKKQFKTALFMFTSAGVSHLFFDSLAGDNTPPFGAPIFWPFSNTFFILPVSIFSSISRASTSELFLASLFNSHNFHAVLIELAILCPILLIIIYIRKNKFIDK